VRRQLEKPQNKSGSNPESGILWTFASRVRCDEKKAVATANLVIPTAARSDSDGKWRNLLFAL
jgi:hypothetical protein